MSSTYIGDPPAPLANILPAYPYQQYSDDINIVAFFNAYNAIVQTYLDWFNDTPLAIYTSPNVSGPLLDWIGQGIYGIPRPVFSSLTTHFEGAAINEFAFNSIAIDGSKNDVTGTAIVGTDDYYKRVLTWHTYIGDGKYTNFQVLRRRIARFLYGINGGDITAAQAQNVSIAVGSSPNAITISIPAGTASQYFQRALEAGTLAFPFQLVPTVEIA